MSEFGTYWIRYAFDATRIPPHHRLPTSTRLRGEMPVQIRHLNAIDAPDAITIQRKEKAAQIMRWDGEALFRPLEDHTGGLVTRERLKELMEGGELAYRDAPVWLDYPFPRQSRANSFNGKKSTWHENPISLKTVEEFGGRPLSDKRAEAEIAVAAAALDLLVVDDVIHRRIPEPRWSLDFSSYHAEFGLKRSGRPSKDAGVVECRLDRGAELFEFAQAHTKTLKSGTTPDQVVIHRPEILRFDDISAAGEHLLTRVVSQIDEYAGYLGSNDALACWLDLRRMTPAEAACYTPTLVREAYTRLAQMVGFGLEPRDGDQSFRTHQSRILPEMVQAYERFLAPIVLQAEDEHMMDLLPLGALP